MKNRSFNIIASIAMALMLTGCNQSEIDKLSLIGDDKSYLEEQDEATFEKRTPDIELFALYDKSSPDAQEPHTTGMLINGKVELSMTTKVGKYTFMQLDEMLTKEYGKPVATKDHIFDKAAISGLDCIETKTCGAGKYYEVFRGKDRFVLLINGAGYLYEKEGVALLTITDKQLKVARLEEDKKH